MSQLLADTAIVSRNPGTRPVGRCLAGWRPLRTTGPSAEMWLVEAVPPMQRVPRQSLGTRMTRASVAYAANQLGCLVRLFCWATVCLAAGCTALPVKTPPVAEVLPGNLPAPSARVLDSRRVEKSDGEANSETLPARCCTLPESV